MSHIAATAGWDSTASPLSTVKPHDMRMTDWAESHVQAVLEEGDSTGTASGSGVPITHIVKWTHPSIRGEITDEVVVYGTTAELDAAVLALKDAIAANGGHVTSG